MKPYGPVTHHLMRARELLHRHQPTDSERRILDMIRLNLDRMIKTVRQLHHRDNLDNKF